mgnify:CR=1 FL=1
MTQVTSCPAGVHGTEGGGFDGSGGASNGGCDGSGGGEGGGVKGGNVGGENSSAKKTSSFDTSTGLPKSNVNCECRSLLAWQTEVVDSVVHCSNAEAVVSTPIANQSKPPDAYIAIISNSEYALSGSRGAGGEAGGVNIFFVSASRSRLFGK